MSVTAIWAKRFGAADDQNTHDINNDLAGNMVVTGSYMNVIDFGGGALPHSAINDGFVAKLDPTGQFVWNRAFTSTIESAGNNVRFDRFGNSITSGGFLGTVDFGGGPLVSPSAPVTIFVAKYAPDGTHVWSKRFGDAGGNGAAFQSGADDFGNVYVAAIYSDGVVDFGCGPLAPAGDYDALLAKLDPAGNCLWSKRFGDAGFQQTSAATVDLSGNVLITGILGGTVDFGGGPLTSAGGQDVFVAKFDPAGNHLWSKRFGDAADQVGVKITTTNAGNIVFIGSFAGTLDLDGNSMTCAGANDGFVGMLDANGNHLWSRQFGGTGEDGLVSVAADNWGNVGIIGHFNNDTVDLGGGPLVSVGGFDIAMAKFDSTGNHLWSARFGDSQDQFGGGIALDSTGHTNVTGVFTGSIDLGTGPLVSVGGTDSFVAKFPP